MAYLGTKPANQVIDSTLIADGTVTTSDLADNAVTTAKIAAGAVVQADLAAGVAGTGPAFFAFRAGGQSISLGTATKIQFTTETFDTNNCFDSTTNYRFTPNVAGYYQISVGAAVQNTGTNYYFDVVLHKNGTNAFIGTLFGGGGNGTAYFRGSSTVVVYCNGTTDYLEVYCFSNQPQTTDFCYFSGALVRAA
jgi:hypothetical protein